ncbi:macrophage mannose receptor 1-like protein [Aphelenchoides avenae]|nr:macrophage mannose receptor 1-like protein [Aphelenchus avenae]
MPFGLSYASEMLTWSDANRSCKEDGGRLVVIEDAAENDWLADFSAFSRRISCAAWIGLHDVTASQQWIWVDGSSPATFFWAKGEPNDLTGSEKCVHLYARQTEANDEHAHLHGKWNDDRCDETHDFICENAAKQ